MKVNGLILAAGMSRRMGDFKPLLKINNKTMIQQSIDSMLMAGTDSVTVVLGYKGEKIEEVLRSNDYLDRNVTVIYNENYETTQMLDSVKIGVNSISSCDAFYLLPGDMPAINKSTFLKVRKTMEQTKATVVFPTIDGFKKHPPLISSNLIKDILNFNSDGGLRELWKDFDSQIVTVPVDDTGCNLDVDTKVQYKYVCQYMSV